MIDDPFVNSRISQLANAPKVEAPKPSAPAPNAPRDPLSRPPARQAPPPARSSMGSAEVVRAAGPKIGLSGGLRALQRFGGVGASAFVSGLFMDSRPDTGQEADFLRQFQGETPHSIGEALSPGNLEIPYVRDIREVRGGAIEVPVEGTDGWFAPMLAPLEIPSPLPLESPLPRVIPAERPRPLPEHIPWKLPVRDPYLEHGPELPAVRIRFRDYGSHVALRFDRRFEPRRPDRRQRDTKAQYRHALTLINATYGVFDEVQDAVESVLWAIWVPLGGNRWTPAMSAYRGDVTRSIRAVLSGEARFDPLSAVENLAFEEMTDLYYAARGHLLLQAFRRLRLQSIPGPETQHLGGFSDVSPLQPLRRDLRSLQSRRLSSSWS